MQNTANPNLIDMNETLMAKSGHRAGSGCFNSFNVKDLAKLSINSKQKKQKR